MKKILEMLKFSGSILDIYSYVQIVFCTMHFVCSTRTVPFFFSAGFICAFCFLSFLLNIYYLYVHIQLHSSPNNIIWFVQLHCALAFLFFLFLFFPVCFVLFLLNIYYLYVYIQLHQLNKFLKYFHNYLTICNVHRPLFFFFSFFLFST